MALLREGGLDLLKLRAKSRAVLAEPLEATLSFPSSPGPMKVFRLSTRTGERQGELPVNPDGSFTIPKSAHTIYFEIVRDRLGP